MSTRGYAIVHRLEKLPDLDEGASETANYTAYKIELDGGVTSLGQRQALSMISCDAEGQGAVTTGDVLTVIPSADGATLAKVEMTTTCARKSGELTFLDADTLEVLEGPIQLEDIVDVNMLVSRAWTEDGRFMIATQSLRGLQGTSYAPSSDPEDIGDIDYSCFYPETVSSDVNANDQSISNEDGVLRIDEPFEGQSRAFGCH
jgi:hypothetical protein